MPLKRKPSPARRVRTRALDAPAAPVPSAAVDRGLWTRGCIRQPSRKRQRRDGPTYKKGYEVRLAVETRSGALRLAAQLRAAGLGAGRPYAHHNGFIVPIYGREAVEWYKRQA